MERSVRRDKISVNLFMSTMSWNSLERLTQSVECCLGNVNIPVIRTLTKAALYSVYPGFPVDSI